MDGFIEGAGGSRSAASRLPGRRDGIDLARQLHGAYVATGWRPCGSYRQGKSEVVDLAGSADAVARVAGTCWT